MTAQRVELAPDFGTFCAVAERALEFANKKVTPVLPHFDEVILDFEGIRNVNSSFTNALIGGLVARHGPDVLQKLRFANCNPIVKVSIASALTLALMKGAGHAAA